MSSNYVTYILSFIIVIAASFAVWINCKSKLTQHEEKTFTLRLIEGDSTYEYLNKSFSSYNKKGFFEKGIWNADSSVFTLELNKIEEIHNSLFKEPQKIKIKCNTLKL